MGVVNSYIEKGNHVERVIMEKLKTEIDRVRTVLKAANGFYKKDMTKYLKRLERSYRALKRAGKA